METDWKKLKGKIGELRLSSGDLQKLAIRAADPEYIRVIDKINQTYSSEDL